VDRAGLSRQSAQWSHTGTFLERDVMCCSHNSNWLIAQAPLTTTVAREVSHHRLSNTSDTQEDLKPQPHTLTKVQTANVTTDQKLQWDTSDSVVTTLPRVIKMSLPKDCTM
jgi:hypothetical protein